MFEHFVDTLHDPGVKSHQQLIHKTADRPNKMEKNCSKKKQEESFLEGIGENSFEN